MRIHSLMLPKCIPGISTIAGRGLFAREDLAAGELVAIWGGKIYRAEEVDRLAAVFPHFATHTVSVCEVFYLGSENLFELDDSELFNHSCEPNTGVRGQILIVARRPIEAGEELTFDYDTTEIAADPFECRCGATRCRERIDGSAWRDAGFVRENWPFLSMFVQDKIHRENPGLAAACTQDWFQNMAKINSEN